MPRALTDFDTLHHPHIFQQQLQAFHQQFKVFHHQQHQHPYYNPMASLYAHCASSSPTSQIQSIPFPTSSSSSLSVSSSSSPESTHHQDHHSSLALDITSSREQLTSNHNQINIRPNELTSTTTTTTTTTNTTTRPRLRLEHRVDEIGDLTRAQLSPQCHMIVRAETRLNYPSQLKESAQLSAISGHSSKGSVRSSAHLVNGLGHSLKAITKRSNRANKPKRVRTIFTPEQLKCLEQNFANQMYLVGPDRVYLAKSLNLTESQVKVWFQNRRIKFRKINSNPIINNDHRGDFSDDEFSDDIEATTSSNS